MLLLLLVVLLLPYAIRYVTDEPILFGGEPYYHLRIGRAVQEEGVPKLDPFLFGHWVYDVNFYHLVLSTLFLLADPILVSVFLPILLAVCTFFLFYHTLKHFKVPANYRLAGLVILVISAPYIFTFTRSSPDAFAVFLNLLGFYLLLRKSTSLKIAAIVVLSLVPFLGLLHAVATLVFLLSLAIRKEYSWTGPAIVVVAASGLIRLVLSNQAFLSQGLMVAPLAEFISDLGGLSGFGAFNLLLAVVGLVSTWRQKRLYASFYLAGGFFVVLSLFDTDMTIYTMFLVALLGGIGFLRLYKMRWELKQIKFLSLLLLVCGLLFSTTSFLNVLVSSGPHSQLKESLEWLQSQDGEVVFTHHSRGFWVQTIAEKQVVLEDFYYLMQNASTMQNDSQTIFYSRNLQKTRELLDSYNVSYILIDQQMRQGLVWKEEEEGLLFLFRNNETFKSRYNISGVEIWSYLGE